MDQPRPPSWKWTVCGLLLLATMLNYMDRQTLSQLATTVRNEYGLSRQQYGDFEMGFGLAFAAGALFFGFLVDRVGARWLYPSVLVGWSLAGIATAYADEIGRTLLDWGAFRKDGATATTGHSHAAYVGFMTCRVVLGFFEAGHWPCALVTTQRILDQENRSFGNSILQSGAAFGAIITPIIVVNMLRTQLNDAGVTVVEPGGWRPPFVVIGLIGMAWILPWLLLIRSRDLAKPHETTSSVSLPEAGTTSASAVFWRRFFVLVVGVICINTSWQFFRAWLPMFLEEQHGYNIVEVGYFTSAYYVATDVGCIAAGLAVKWLAGAGWSVHRARLSTFGICAVLTALSAYAAFSPRGPMLLVMFLIIGAGALGLFPNYYSFTQELSQSHQGKITGILGAIGWIGTSPLQPLAGRIVDDIRRTDPGRAFTPVIVVAGLAPLLAFAALWLFWGKNPEKR